MTDPTPKWPLLILAMIAELIGFAIVVHGAGWGVAAGVFLAIVGNNMARDAGSMK